MGNALIKCLKCQCQCHSNASPKSDQKTRNEIEEHIAGYMKRKMKEKKRKE